MQTIFTGVLYKANSNQNQHDPPPYYELKKSNSLENANHIYWGYFIKSDWSSITQWHKLAVVDCHLFFLLHSFPSTYIDFYPKRGIPLEDQNPNFFFIFFFMKNELNQTGEEKIKN